MKIFLDIDGVMVPSNSWKMPEFLADGFPAFSPRAVVALQKIIDDTKAEVILTSSHKTNYTTQEWLILFLNRGVDVVGINCLPENTANLSRSAELVSWFNLNGSDENFVIIDDDKQLNELPAFLKDKLILTSGAIGLTEEHVNTAIAFLCNKPHPLGNI